MNEVSIHIFAYIPGTASKQCCTAFLAWLRLSIYMAIVSVAIMVSFHLKSKPTAFERKLAMPMGIIFWCLSLACLASGVATYCRTVTGYSRRAALVQTGWKTEMVSDLFLLHSGKPGGLRRLMLTNSGVYCCGYSYCCCLCVILVDKCE
jgi:hypothetical protein